MTSVGIDQNTGKVLVGWAHVSQSIHKILTTELGSRIERRDFGSSLSSLIDKPQNEETMLKFFMAIAEALEPRRVRNSIYGEPRFALEAVSLDARTPGIVAVSVSGLYFPDGHKGRIFETDRRILVVKINAPTLQ